MVESHTYTARLPAFAIIQQLPIIRLIIVIPIVLHRSQKQFAKEVVIGRFVECEFPDIV